MQKKNKKSWQENNPTQFIRIFVLLFAKTTFTLKTQQQH
jgi:hypothetical protein